MVELAKDNLRHFDCVGMLYDMERFHRLLSEKVGIDLDPFEKTNSSPPRICVGSLTHKELSAFEAANVFDLEVYEAVREYYERSSASGQEHIA